MRVVAATPERGDDLLRLLEENAMQGDIDLVMTRRPDYFLAQHDFGHEYSALALDGERAVGLCRLTCHQGYANGAPQTLGYLGGLRIAQDDRHRIRVLKMGFRHLRQLPAPDYCYTSIATDNLPALRLLERGLPGLPRYRPLGEMHTLAIARSRAKRRRLWRIMPPERYDEVAAFYNRSAQARQLAPALRGDWLREAGVTVLGSDNGGALSACGVLWDRQAHKQVLVARYSRRARLLRPLYNAFARATGRVPLPGAGQLLDHSFLAFFAAKDVERIPALTEDALSLCATSVMMLGLPAAMPGAARLAARCRAMVYRTRLYGVDLTLQPGWDDAVVWPEVALL